MRNLVFTFILIALISSGCVQKKNEKGKQYCIIGYVYGANGVDFDKLDVTKFTHINYAFGNIVDGKIKCEFENDIPNIKRIIDLKEKHNPDLKLMLSVGGWTWSGNFSDMALTEESREVFIKSALDFIDKTNIDGIDLDWEYPGQRGMNNIFRKEDKTNFTLLLKELREALDNKSQIENREEKYLLTIATGANQNYVDKTEMDKCSKYLDLVNLMTYDFYTGGDVVSGHQANLYKHEYDKKGISVDKAVKIFLNAGVPKDKLVVGIPFYTRAWGGIKPNNQNGQYIRAEKKFPYKRDEIKKFIEEGKLPLYRDKKSKAAYRWSEELGVFISVEDTTSVKLKANYIKENNLRGAMYWSFSPNTSDLLDALNRGFN